MAEHYNIQIFVNKSNNLTHYTSYKCRKMTADISRNVLYTVRFHIEDLAFSSKTKMILFSNDIMIYRERHRLSESVMFF